MTTAPLSAIAPARDRVSERDLDADLRPLVVIDVDAAEIIAANASGSAAFGLFPYASFPIALDPATPALTRLREIADLDSREADKRGPETLMFWRNRHPKPMTCTITRRGTGGSPVFLLRVIDGDESADETALSAEPEPLLIESDAGSRAAHAAEDQAAEPPPRSDIETLKEIARQIRESDLGPGVAPTTRATDVTMPTPVASPIASPTADLAAHVPDQPALSTAGLSSGKTLPVLDPDHLAKLAHELKTPLTAIAAAAEVMRDERLGEMGNERYLSYAADIHESATHALDVITALLSESGRPASGVSRLIALDLNALVERTVSSMQALAGSRGLTLAFDAEKSRPHVVANPTAIRQILLNLLTNAIKFTPDGGDVRVVTGYLADGRVFLVVRDTGCGMNGKPPVAAETVAPGNAALPLARGNGIGLPLVQRLVRDMGAELEIDSAPQKGTAVLIAFGGFARWSA
jgi:hypothetical protein